MDIVADLMERRKIEILCVQEFQWKGNKAIELINGYKLLYSEVNDLCRSGVGIIPSKRGLTE